jgi:capsular exopolysaccharide synthesis family protein
VQTITLPTDVSTPVSAGVSATQSTVMSSFFSMKIQRQSLELDAQAIARALPGGETDSISVDALSAVGAVQGSPELSRALQDLVVKRADVRALLQQYTREHPTVRQAQDVVVELERRTIPTLARRLLGEVESRISVLDNLIDGASEELREIPPRSIEEARLRRAVTIAEVLYNDLHQRHETARLAAETTVPDLSEIDRASPPSRPTNDPRMQLILMGLAGAFGLGVAIAILLDRADPRLRYADQVTDDLRLGIIGAVPSLKRARKGLIAAGDGAKMTEALRAVRLSLMHAYGSAGPIVVTITSPGSGVGKTCITSNLALTFADLGMRTRGIDGDTRRGQMHRLYDVDRKPGLTDYLTGSSSLQDAVRTTAYPMVDLMPLGSRRQDAPELLSSGRMGDLLAEIRPQYQVILIDSPPLGAGVDPLVLATLSGSLVMVMRTGRTDRAVAEAKLKMLDRLPVRVLGVVLNGFDTEDSYRYYSYLPGYETGNEEAESSPELLQPV